MLEMFRAIGFDVTDEASYNRLAETAEALGDRTRIWRRGATLHGRCWRIGAGLEVWTILRESEDGLYYADCRPAFRPRHAQALGPWELVEYDEDGEAVVEGSLTRGPVPVSFELQNLTELAADTFTRAQLSVSLAGLAYDVRRVGPGAAFGLAPSDRDSAAPPPDGSDYVAVGRVVRSSPLVNAHTGVALAWLQLDIGGAPLEVVARREDLDRSVGAGDTVEVGHWLQGYVLGEEAARARFEGVDPEWKAAESWSLLRRGN